MDSDGFRDGQCLCGKPDDMGDWRGVAGGGAALAVRAVPVSWRRKADSRIIAR